MRGLVVVAVLLTVAAVNAGKWNNWQSKHSGQIKGWMKTTDEDGNEKGWMKWAKDGANTNARPRPCKNQDDCGSEECCVHQKLHPWNYLFGMEYTGMCQPLRQEGEECSVPQSWTSLSTTAYDVCGCASGLTCQQNVISIHGFDVPLDLPTCQSDSEGSGDDA